MTSARNKIYTSKQIQGDAYRLLLDSDIARNISGNVYREGHRPRDSKKEDAVVIFTAGSTNEIQQGYITINIFVQDIDPYGNGVFVENGERCEEIETLAAEWVENDLRAKVSDYYFELAKTICTEYEQEINQHFVVIQLKYKLYKE